MYDEEFRKINEDREEINSIYINSLTKIGSTYFKETLSELSRKRQNILLLTAIITILVAFAIVTPIEGELGGIKYQFSNIGVFKQLAATITSYYFLVYIISALRDIRFNYYQNLPATLETHNLMNRMTQAIIDRTKRVQRLRKEFENRLSARSEQQKELRALFEEVQNEYRAQRDKLRKQEWESFENSGYKDFGSLQSEIDKISQKSKEEVDAFYELRKEMLASDGVKDLTDLITGEALDHSIDEKIDGVLKAIKFRKLNDFLGTLIEIIFPLGLAIYAMYVGFFLH